MRMRCVVAWLCAALTVAGCGPLPDAEQKDAENVPVATKATGTVSREELKRAAERVLSIECADAQSEPDYKEAAQLVEAAGTAIVTILAELVGDRSTSAHVVHNAVKRAATYSFSDGFRKTLRTRRDDVGLSAFRYFAKFGDATDLAWMESVATTFDEHGRSYAAEPIAQLRQRLGLPQKP